MISTILGLLRLRNPAPQPVEPPPTEKPPMSAAHHAAHCLIELMTEHGAKIAMGPLMQIAEAHRRPVDSRS